MKKIQEVLVIGCFKGSIGESCVCNAQFLIFQQGNGRIAVSDDFAVPLEYTVQVRGRNAVFEDFRCQEQGRGIQCRGVDRRIKFVREVIFFFGEGFNILPCHRKILVGYRWNLQIDIVGIHHSVAL